MYCKKLVKTYFFVFLFVPLFATGCGFMRALLVDEPEPAAQTASQEDFHLEMIAEPSAGGNSGGRNTTDSTKRHESERPKETAYSGKVIAVPAPQLQNPGADDSWIPQFLQDSLTGHFASFSGMTVLDRKNESVIVAEQKLSESGLYSTDNAAEFGQLTSAEYVLTGSIQKLPSRYALNFRVNNISTNEIKASFSGQYSLADIENGAAVKDAVSDLFNGLGIALSNAQLAGLTKNQSAASSTKSLAQGMAAQKNGDFITALTFLADSSAGGNKEASAVISSMLVSATPADIRARAAYYKEQTAKWTKIWKDVEVYLVHNYLILVHDLDPEKMQSDVSGSGDRVNLKWAEGIRFVPNRKALVLYNTVAAEWEKIRNAPENKAWVREVHTLPDSFGYYMEIGLYNKYGELLKTDSIRQAAHLKTFRYENEAVPPQFRLFNNTRAMNVAFYSVAIDDKFSEPLTTKIIEFRAPYSSSESFTPRSLSLQEWHDVLKAAE